MKRRLLTWTTRVRDGFASFTAGQKTIAVIGAAAVLVAAVMMVRWIAAPSYSPLYSGLSGEDASAVIDELDTKGIDYQLAGGGGTIMVPRDQVYDTRIALSGEGLPASSDGGYSLLDDQSISTSQFQEQTDFKRAMEGELSKTVEAIDGVDAAVVHLALPPAKVFSDEQDPPTASVLVDTAAGSTLDNEQVQAVVHLVASSIDGLDPADVTVADSSGKVLSTSDGAGLAGGAREQQVADFQKQTSARIQGMLDRVLGAGNSTVQVTADLDFDKSVSETKTYERKPRSAPLSSSTTSEDYNGTGASNGTTGVVGPDGQMGSTGTTAGNPSSYTKKSETRDNAIGSTVEHRETAPGSVNSMHVGVVLDTLAAGQVNPQEVQDLISSTIGIDEDRGDTVQVSVMPFDRTADKAAAAELAAAKKAEATARTRELLRDGGIALLVLAILLLAWVRGRRKARRDAQATTYLVEQLRQDAERPRPQVETSPALTALESHEPSAGEQARQELESLVEKQPEHVAALLRGWLAERS